MDQGRAMYVICLARHSACCPATSVSKLGHCGLGVRVGQTGTQVKNQIIRLEEVVNDSCCTLKEELKMDFKSDQLNIQ